MPIRRYVLDKGEEKRVTVQWERGFRNIKLYLDGKVIAGPLDTQQIRRGVEFRLPKGKPVRVQLIRGIFANGIGVSIEGTPLPGSPEDPAPRYHTAGAALALIAAANLVQGILAAVSRFSLFIRPESWPVYIGYGLLYLPLIFLAFSGCRYGVLLAFCLYSSDALLLGFRSIALNQVNPMTVTIRVMLLIAIGQAMGVSFATRKIGDQHVGR